MPRKLPPYVQIEPTRYGVRYYFRVGKGKRVRLPPVNSPRFTEEYLAALKAHGPTEKHIVGVNSIAWLIDRYRETGAYLALSAATRKQRDNIFKHVVESSGGEPYRAINRESIVAAREARKATPAQARNFLDAMRGMFRWALEAGLVKTDPTEGVKNPARPKSAGFKEWTEEDVSRYEERWPEGTKERVWLHVLLYTGLRRGDAVRIGRQHVRNGVATIRTEKTDTEVSIPILPVLAETLDRGPTGDLAFIVGEMGRPLTKESFGNLFRVACNEAGVQKSAHGVRKIGATRAAEAGATVNELEALFGWSGGTMASYYTRAADRKRLAKSASEKMANAMRPRSVGASPQPRKDIV